MSVYPRVASVCESQCVSVCVSLSLCIFFQGASARLRSLRRSRKRRPRQCVHVKHARARKGGIVHPSLRCSQHLQVADVSQNLSAPVLHGGVVATPFTGATETARAALEVTAHSEDLLKNTGRDPAYACQFDHVTCNSQSSLSSITGCASAKHGFCVKTVINVCDMS